MKKLITIPLVSVCMIAAALAAALPVQGYVFEQRQSATFEANTECSSNCSAKVTSSMSQEQFSRSFTRLDSGHRGSGSAGGFFNWENNWSGEDHEGSVTLRWDQAGGTCTIRYSEANVRWYKYSTSTACDNGEVTVGGLVPGRAYRFQIKPDDANWSRIIRRVAR